MVIFTKLSPSLIRPPGIEFWHNLPSGTVPTPTPTPTPTVIPVPQTTYVPVSTYITSPPQQQPTVVVQPQAELPNWLVPVAVLIGGGTLIALILSGGRRKR